MMYDYGNHVNGWGVLVMGVGSLLLWVALALGVLALVRHLRTAAPAGPEQLLAGRYARGEIDDGEYQRRLDTLRRQSADSAHR